MEIKSTYIGRTILVAHVPNVTVNDNADTIIDAVVAHFGETRGRLFGWGIDYMADGLGATVSLHKD